MAETQESHGPVLNTIHKRLRSLRKKLTRIHHMEELLSQGKILNKEQEETLSSKAAVTGAINELEKLIQPLTDAVKQEIHVSETDMEKKHPFMVEEVLKLLYVGILFDIQSQTDCTAMMAIKEYERGCCLLYDHVSDDDDADILGLMDLNQIANLGRLILSRPLDSSLSHQNALRQCLEHARLWINNSPQPIGSDPSVTYAGLRRKLNKIMDSEYFTKTPEMKARIEFQPGSFQVPSQGTVIPINAPDQVEVPQVQVQVEHEQKEEAEVVKTQGIGNFVDISTAPDDVYQGEEGEKFSEIHVDTEKSEIEKGLEYIAGASNQQYRGGRAGSRGGRRGYSNGGRRGRGNRGGGGAYFNGRNQFYEQGDGYYPRNNNYFRGRGGRGGGGGGGSNNNNYQVGEGGYLVAN